MSAIKDIGKNVNSTYSLLTERGILGGAYFGFILFTLFLSIVDFKEYKDIFPWILVITFVIGIIISNVSYELLMSSFRMISSPIVIKGANQILKEKDFKFSNYSELRIFREIYLSKEGNSHLNNRIKKDEKLRQTLTYLASTNIVSVLFIVSICYLFEPDEKLISLIMLVIIFMFLSTLFGIIVRAKSLGRHVGLAYLEENEQ